MLFAFHQLGYYFFYVASKYQINKSWEEKIQNQQIREQDFSYLALPMSYPYQQNQEMYQPTNELLEFGSEYFRVIKKRYANDTLHIIYTKDLKTQHLKKSFKEWVNTIYQEKNPDSKRQIVISSVDKNYFKNDILLDIQAPEKVMLEFNDRYALHEYFHYFPSLEHPPKLS